MLLIVAAMLGALTEPAPQPLRLPEWMAGCWESRSGDKWTEECWSQPRGPIMIGYGRSGTGGVLDSWEVMQIEMIETDDPVIDPLTFYGAPGGKNRTAFSWVRTSTEPGITFVNLGHDYPQRIGYWRDGKELIAEVSLGDGSKAQRWHYSPMGMGKSSLIEASSLPKRATRPLTRAELRLVVPGSLIYGVMPPELEHMVSLEQFNADGSYVRHDDNYEAHGIFEIDGNKICTKAEAEVRSCQYLLIDENRQFWISKSLDPSFYRQVIVKGI